MAKKKGLSLEEKRQRILQLFYDKVSYTFIFASLKPANCIQSGSRYLIPIVIEFELFRGNLL